MAAKYWYRPSNVNGDWSSAGDWYSQPGGNGAILGVPTSADDAYLTAESGTGTLSITAAAVCRSLNIAEDFTGGLAGASALTVGVSIYFGAGLNLTYTGLITLNGVGVTGEVVGSLQYIKSNIVINGAGSTWTFTDVATLSNNTITLTAGTLNTTASYNTYGLECGVFISTGTGVRTLWEIGSASNVWNITGAGTVWNVAGSNITCHQIPAAPATPYRSGFIEFTNSSNSSKTIIHSLTGFNIPNTTTLTGGGAGAFLLSANLFDVICTNTSSAQVSLGTGTISGDVFDFSNTNVNWNNTGAFTLTFTGTAVQVNLSPTMTITNSGTIVILGAGFNISSGGKALTGALTINGGYLYVYDLFTNNGLVTLTAGSIVYSGYDMSFGALSTSNSNARSISIPTLYLTGSGTLIAATNQTGLYFFEVQDIIITSNANLAKTLTLFGSVSVLGGVTLAGSGSALTTMSFNVNSANIPNVYVSKLGGTLTLGTSTVRSLEFYEGSTITWANTAVALNIIEGGLGLCNSMSVTSTPSPIAFLADANGYLVTANKTFTGILSILSIYGLTIAENYTSTSTSTGAISITTEGSVIFNNNVTVAGNIVINSGVAGGGLGNQFANVTFGAVTQGASLTSAAAISLTDANVTLGSTTVTGALTFSSFGSLGFYNNSILNLGSFVSSSSTAIRSIGFGNAVINLNGTGTVWNTSTGVSTGVLDLQAFDATVNVTRNDVSTVILNLGSIGIGNLNINRSQSLSVGSSVITQVLGFDNFFKNFKDLTKVTPGAFHDIYFSGSSSNRPTAIRDTFQVGNPDNQTRLVSTSTNPFYLLKSSPGLVICPNVYINLSRAEPVNTWYAIGATTDTTSVDAGSNTGWIFGVPPMRLGTAGVG